MQSKFTPTQFIKLFEEFNIEIRNPNYSGTQLNTGITNAGRFYSVEVLFEMLISISGTYGRLAYRQDQSGNDDTLSTTFKKLSMGFLDLANTSYHITNADNIIKFTELAGKNIAWLKEFENEHGKQ